MLYMVDDAPVQRPSSAKLFDPFYLACIRAAPPACHLGYPRYLYMNSKLRLFFFFSGLSRNAYASFRCSYPRQFQI